MKQNNLDVSLVYREETRDLAAAVEGLDSLELVGTRHVNNDNIHTIAKMLKERNLQIFMLVPGLWTHYFIGSAAKDGWMQSQHRQLYSA